MERQRQQLQKIRRQTDQIYALFSRPTNGRQNRNNRRTVANNRPQPESPLLTTAPTVMPRPLLTTAPTVMPRPLQTRAPTLMPRPHQQRVANTRIPSAANHDRITAEEQRRGIQIIQRQTPHIYEMMYNPSVSAIPVMPLPSSAETATPTSPVIPQFSEEIKRELIQLPRNISEIVQDTSNSHSETREEDTAQIRTNIITGLQQLQDEGKGGEFTTDININSQSYQHYIQNYILNAFKGRLDVSTIKNTITGDTIIYKYFIHHYIQRETENIAEELLENDSNAPGTIRNAEEYGEIYKNSNINTMAHNMEKFIRAIIELNKHATNETLDMHYDLYRILLHISNDGISGDNVYNQYDRYGGGYRRKRDTRRRQKRGKVSHKKSKYGRTIRRR